MAVLVLCHIVIWISLLAGALSTESGFTCSHNYWFKNHTCVFGFSGTFSTWRSITCNLFALPPPARIHMELTDFCSSVSTDNARVSVEWREQYNADSSFELRDCSKGHASKVNDMNKHVRVEAQLGKNDSLDVNIFVKRPQAIRLLARASSGGANIYCLHSNKTPVYDDTTIGVQTAEESTIHTTENITTRLISTGESTVAVTSSILASVVVVALLGVAVLYVRKRKRSESLNTDAAVPTAEDLGQREATPESSPDATDYDVLGRFRKPEGASVDPTYGHLEPEEGDYSHVQRGPSKRPLVIKGDNVYGHLDTAGE